jgi:release factor glutamine methyltransferase
VSDPVSDAAARLREAGIPNPRMEARLLFEHAKSPPLPTAGGGEPIARSASGSGEGGVEEPLPQSALAALDPIAPSRKGRGETSAEQLQLFSSLISRRASREPLAYITGRKEFWSLDLAVGPGVLIPRPDTETLIEELTRLHPDRAAPLSILDLGTGSGCLLIAALHEYPNARGTGIDSSSEALAIARANIARHRLENRATLVLSGWPDQTGQAFDVILSNPPYIPSAQIEDLEPEVARHEPRAALDGGPDGLDAYRALAPRLGRLLNPGGHALLEIGRGQDGAVEGLMAAAGLQTLRTVPDLAGIPRCLVVKSQSCPI